MTGNESVPAFANYAPVMLGMRLLFVIAVALLTFARVTHAVLIDDFESGGFSFGPGNCPPLLQPVDPRFPCYVEEFGLVSVLGGERVALTHALVVGDTFMAELANTAANDFVELSSTTENQRLWLEYGAFAGGVVDLTDGGSSDGFIVDVRQASLGSRVWVVVWASNLSPFDAYANDFGSPVYDVTSAGTIEIPFSDFSTFGWFGARPDFSKIERIILNVGPSPDGPTWVDDFRTDVPEPLPRRSWWLLCSRSGS